MQALAALEIAEFFAGTTDETTSVRTFRCARNPETTSLKSSLVTIREGAEIRLFEANANLVYELLISISK